MAVRTLSSQNYPISNPHLVGHLRYACFASFHRCLFIHISLQVEYKGKGYFTGKSHSFKAIVTPPNSTTAKHTIEGQWHTTSKDAYGVTFHDVQGPKEEVTVAPVSEQDEWESRNLWNLVAKGIREGDFELASREKSKIEVCQSRLIFKQLSQLHP